MEYLVNGQRDTFDSTEAVVSVSGDLTPGVSGTKTITTITQNPFRYLVTVVPGSYSSPPPTTGSGGSGTGGSSTTGNDTEAESTGDGTTVVYARDNESASEGGGEGGASGVGAGGVPSDGGGGASGVDGSIEEPNDEAAIPPIIKPPFMDWDAPGPDGLPNPRLHCPNNEIPDHVPKDWSREKIIDALRDVETSIKNRREVLDPKTESPDAHERHVRRIEEVEEKWKETLERALKSAAVTGVATGAGYSIQKVLEGTGMFLDRAARALFFMVSPPGMWDDPSGPGPGAI